MILRAWPAPPPYKNAALSSGRKKGRHFHGFKLGAGNGVRTRDPKLGKLVLYQLSYARSIGYFLAQAGLKVKCFCGLGPGPKAGLPLAAAYVFALFFLARPHRPRRGV